MLPKVWWLPDAETASALPWDLPLTQLTGGGGGEGSGCFGEQQNLSIFRWVREVIGP